MKFFLMVSVILLSLIALSQNKDSIDINPAYYLNDLKSELKVEYPKNKIINLVFHGHSVPAGYFKTPMVNTLSAYPYLLLEKLKSIYPCAVINVIVTAKGGESSIAGAKRFEKDVLVHKPDVLFINYSLNDREQGLEKAYEAWEEMIKKAKAQGIPVILFTPSPDLRVDYSSPENDLKKHADQIIKLAKENHVALVNNYKTFEFLYSDKKKLAKYMAQVNHPNELGHELIANEIIKWFK